MNFDAATIALLVCPFCESALKIGTVATRDAAGGVEHGVLECAGCRFAFPVVAGIPIMMAPHETLDSMYETSAQAFLPGPRMDHLVALIRGNQPAQALALLLNPSKLNGDWFFSFERSGAKERALLGDGNSRSLKTRVRNKARKALAKHVLPRARQRFAEFLLEHEAELSAMDVLDFYYRRFSGTESFNYFAYRFGQPRHLAGLGLASLLDDASGPVLDLACGVGHVTHYLSEANPARKTIGSDRDFFRLWVANRYVAPRALYVCCPADRPLPFPRASLDGIFCSDAFHYFLERAATVREGARLLGPKGALILARFGNVTVQPNEGYELTLAGYAALLADMPHVFAGESELVRAYAARQSPELTRPTPPAELENEKWLSVVASQNPDFFRPSERFARWPHALGRLQQNPIYVESAGSTRDELALELRFPSEWYAFENQAYLSYAPKTSTLPRAALADPEAHADIDRYISSFVMIGMPEAYLESKHERASRRGSAR